MINTYTQINAARGKRIIWGSPKEYVQSISRSIAHYRNSRASAEYMNYLYGLYYDALDDLWEEQGSKNP